MTELTLTTRAGELAERPAVSWQDALAVYLDTLSSPRTRRAYERAVTEAMRAMGAALVCDLDPRTLAAYRAGLVERMDAGREDRLSPASVKLALAALRSFLNFCRVAGAVTLGKDLIAYALKSPRAEVLKPYEVLNADERQAFLDAAEGARDRALGSLALGAGLRVSTRRPWRGSPATRGRGTCGSWRTNWSGCSPLREGERKSPPTFFR